MTDSCRKHLKDVLNKKTCCYVLITCGEPSEEGEMQVRMTYEGDVTLASYLLQEAQSIFEEEEEAEVSLSDSENSLPLRLVK